MKITTVERVDCCFQFPASGLFLPQVSLPTPTQAPFVNSNHPSPCSNLHFPSSRSLMCTPETATPFFSCTFSSFRFPRFLLSCIPPSLPASRYAFLQSLRHLKPPLKLHPNLAATGGGSNKGYYQAVGTTRIERAKGCTMETASQFELPATTHVLTPEAQ